MPTFPMPTNLTDINKSIGYANNVSEGYLGIALIVIIFTVSFMSLKTRFPSNICLVSSLFTTTIASVMIYLFGILPAVAPPLLGIMTAFSVAFLVIGGGD
jgi:CHASE2 domain-containing sensor protein